MADTCEDCGRVRVERMDDFWKNPSYSCPKDVPRVDCNSSDWLDLYCAHGTIDRLRTLLDRYRALAKAADVLHAGEGSPAKLAAAYAAARAAVREIEEFTSSTTAKTPPAR